PAEDFTLGGSVRRYLDPTLIDQTAYAAYANYEGERWAFSGEWLTTDLGDRWFGFAGYNPDELTEVGVVYEDGLAGQAVSLAAVRGALATDDDQVVVTLRYLMDTRHVEPTLEYRVNF